MRQRRSHDAGDATVRIQKDAVGPGGSGVGSVSLINTASVIITGGCTDNSKNGHTNIGMVVTDVGGAGTVSVANGVATINGVGAIIVDGGKDVSEATGSEDVVAVGIADWTIASGKEGGDAAVPGMGTTGLEAQLQVGMALMVQVVATSPEPSSDH